MLQTTIVILTSRNNRQQRIKNKDIVKLNWGEGDIMRK